MSLDDRRVASSGRDACRRRKRNWRTRWQTRPAATPPRLAGEFIATLSYVFNHHARELFRCSQTVRVRPIGFDNGANVKERYHSRCRNGPAPSLSAGVPVPV
jgi:hypothetical protein